MKHNCYDTPCSYIVQAMQNTLEGTLIWPMCITDLHNLSTSVSYGPRTSATVPNTMQKGPLLISDLGKIH